MARIAADNLSRKLALTALLPYGSCPTRHSQWNNQDQVATLKRQMQRFLPGLHAFLDVDDLTGLNELEMHVRASGVVLLFLGSTKYFSSKNCLREARAAMGDASCFANGLGMENKPLCLVHESDDSKHGSPLEKLRGRCPADLLDYVFGPMRAPRPALSWLRLFEFQCVTLKSVAEMLLLHSPAYRAVREGAIRHQREPELGLKLGGEIGSVSIVFTSPVSLYVSHNNLGAYAIATSLKERHSAIRITEKVAAFNDKPVGGASLSSPSRDDRPPGLAFLLYLNDTTFAHWPESDALAAEVKRAQAAKLPFVLVHERDPFAGGCDFSVIIDATPKDLVAEGLFDQLATPLYPDSGRAAYRDVSMQLLCRDLATRLCPRKEGGLRSCLLAACRRLSIASPNVHPTAASRKSERHVIQRKRASSIFEGGGLSHQSPFQEVLEQRSIEYVVRGRRSSVDSDVVRGRRSSGDTIRARHSSGDVPTKRPSGPSLGRARHSNGESSRPEGDGRETDISEVGDLPDDGSPGGRTSRTIAALLRARGKAAGLCAGQEASEENRTSAAAGQTGQPPYQSSPKFHLPPAWVGRHKLVFLLNPHTRLHSSLSLTPLRYVLLTYH